MRRTLVVGNWKMNGSLASIQELLGGIKAGIASVSHADMVVCPPHIYLAAVADQLQGSAIAWGAQDVSTEPSGAFTGEVASSMLTDFGCTYVIVGHSERRTLYGETDHLVVKKFAAAQKGGLTPIVCVGEILAEREAGDTETVIARQLDAVIDVVGVSALNQAVIAYEPVWAIGTGKTATPEQAQEVHAFIRNRIAGKDASVADGMRILYGGSMKASNAAELLGQTDADGGLIGGASLKADEFLAIGQAAG